MRAMITWALVALVGWLPGAWAARWVTAEVKLMGAEERRLVVEPDHPAYELTYTAAGSWQVWDDGAGEAVEVPDECTVKPKETYTWNVSGGTITAGGTGSNSVIVRFEAGHNGQTSVQVAVTYATETCDGSGSDAKTLNVVVPHWDSYHAICSDETLGVEPTEQQHVPVGGSVNCRVSPSASLYDYDRRIGATIQTPLDTLKPVDWGFQGTVFASGNEALWTAPATPVHEGVVSAVLDDLPSPVPVTELGSRDDPPVDVGSFPVVVVKVTLTRTPPFICAKTAWSHAKLTDSDHTATITVSTDPAGYEGMADLEVLTVVPLGDGEGEVTQVSDSVWHYTPMSEAQGDKWPGWDDPGAANGRSWEVTVGDGWSAATVDVVVRCVFKYCVMNEQDEPMALEYAQWKYASLISAYGLTVGTYSGGSHYGYTTGAGVVTYGDPAFGTENILLSTIGHEDVHVDQGMAVRVWGAEDRILYLVLVEAGTYPAPPALPPAGSEGGEWGELEYPARQWEWLHRSFTGTSNDEDYLEYVEEEMLFFEWLKDNCD